MEELNREKGDATSTASDIGERVALLQEISFFNDLDIDQLTEISHLLLARLYKSGERILTQDKPVDGAYFLQKGEVQVLVSNEQTGQEELITHCFKGECFGEMSTLRGELNASATVLATCDCQFLFIDRENFLELISRYSLWSKFIKIIASRLEQTNHRMTEVMKHLKQGMVQVDPRGLISGKFSMGFVRLIGGELSALHGKPFADVVFSSCPDAQRKWTENFGLAISSTSDQASLILSLLPEECVYHHPENGERVFKISYDLCVYRGEIIGIDIGIEDITRMRELDLKSRELEKEKNIIKEIYTKPETFRTLLRLLDDARSDLSSIANCVEKGEISLENFRSWQGNMHSLKGTSYFLNLEELGDSAHQMETVLSKLKSQDSPASAIQEEFEKKRGALESRIGYVTQILEGMSEETQKRLTAELVLSTEETAELEHSLKNDTTSLDIVLRAKRVSSQKLVEGWKEELERICQTLPKRIIFRSIGEPVPIPGFLYNTIKTPLIHLLRNCAEHGIESEEERRKKKKAPTGLISFNAKVDRDRCELVIQDDGGGVNREDVLSKALEIQERDPELKPKIEKLMEENKILTLLFLPGFSTTKKITTLSGRGVGLDVIQRATNKVGGMVTMRTAPGRGTKFTLSFPLRT